jgi:signal transduction histidine kinase
MTTTSGRTLLRAAGVLSWVLASVPAGRNILEDPSCMGVGGRIGWIAAFGVYGVAFWRSSAEVGVPNPRPGLVATLAVQSIAALVMLALVCSGFESVLLVVVAAELALLLPARVALPWLVVQTALFCLLASYQMKWPYGALWSIGVAGVQAFSFAIAAIAGREGRARHELARANADLRETRGLLARATRDAERLRIARELHDLLGHDLVALSLQLEAARHMASGAAAAPVERALALAKQLLTDIRAAVSRLRDENTEERVDVAAGLRALAVESTKPVIHVEAPESLALPGGHAEPLLRCAREIVTNTLKHAVADNLWIRVAMTERGLELTAHDDGAGTNAIQPGNGLTGMRERLELAGGELAFESRAGAGFSVHAVLPGGGGTT